MRLVCGAQDLKGPGLGVKSRGTKEFPQGMAQWLQETNVWGQKLPVTSGLGAPHSMSSS